MNENTEALIRELSEKLGTTTEHLWGVLVRQAPITGTIDLLMMLAWILVAVLAFRYIKLKTKKPKPATEYEYTEAEWIDETAGIAWAGWFVFTVIMVFVIGASLNGTIGAIVNPEYWALKELLP